MQTTTTNGWNSGPIQSISVTASPFVFINTEICPILVFISAGTVTDISLSPDQGNTWMGIGLLGGCFHVNPGRQLRVTYVLAPTMQYTPV